MNKITIDELLSVCKLHHELTTNGKVNAIIIKSHLRFDAFDDFIQRQPLSAFNKFASKRNVDKAIRVAEEMINDYQTKVLLPLSGGLNLFDEIEEKELHLNSLIGKLDEVRYLNENVVQQHLSGKVPYHKSLTTLEKPDIIFNFHHRYLSQGERIIVHYDRWRKNLQSSDSRRYRENMRDISRDYNLSDFLTFEQASTKRLISMYLCDKEHYQILLTELMTSIKDGNLIEAFRDCYHYLQFVSRTLKRFDFIIAHTCRQYRNALSCCKLPTDKPTLTSGDFFELLQASSEVMGREYFKDLIADLPKPDPINN